MTVSPFFVYILPVLLVITIGLLGSTRRLGFFLSVILSIVLTPIGGFIAALISGPKREKPIPIQSRTERKK